MRVYCRLAKPQYGLFPGHDADRPIGVQVLYSAVARAPPPASTKGDGPNAVAFLGAFDMARVQAVLEACRSVKVKRLFLWFVERHAHPWFGRLDLKRIDLGRGKRQIVVGGRLDSKYQITVPETLDAGV